MKRRVAAVQPVFMIIGIFAGVPFMGFVGFILGPVLIALAVVSFKIFADWKNAPAGQPDSRIAPLPETPGINVEIKS